MHQRGSNPSRENYGFFLMRWGSEARGAGENGGWKATRKGKLMGRGCFYQDGAGKKQERQRKKVKEPKNVAFPRPEQAEISNKPKIKRSCALRMQQLLF